MPFIFWSVVMITCDDSPFVLFVSDPDNKTKISSTKRKNDKQSPTGSKSRKITDFMKK